MNYREMLDKFQALEDEIWKLSQRVSELEKQKQPVDDNWFKKLMEQGN
jgi:hypothetical protein